MAEFGLRKAGAKEINNINWTVVAPRACGRYRWALGGLAILGLTALLAYGCDQKASKSAPAMEPIVPTPATLIQDPALRQCTDITYLTELDLFRNPLTMPNGPKNPQVQHAIDTLYRNGVYDLLAVDILPQGTKLRFLTTNPQTYNFCLPDEVIGKPRFFIKTNEGVGANLPYGSQGNGQIEYTLPDGLNAIVLQRWGERFPGSGKEKQEWFFLNLQPYQSFTFQNSNGSARGKGLGSIAFQTASPTMRYVEFILPERGFADDRPIPQKP